MTIKPCKGCGKYIVLLLQFEDGRFCMVCDKYGCVYNTGVHKTVEECIEEWNKEKESNK